MHFTHEGHLKVQVKTIKIN